MSEARKMGKKPVGRAERALAPNDYPVRASDEPIPRAGSLGTSDARDDLDGSKERGPKRRAKNRGEGPGIGARAPAAARREGG